MNVEPTTALALRSLHDTEELAELIAVFDRIWGTRPGHTMFDLAMLVALEHGGHYVSGAFVDGRLVGGSIGFFVEPLGEVLHSHIAGVLPGHAGAGIGRAVKQHQREWCLARGIRTIQWTFDPLIARNAHFNLRRLGARPTAYAENFYGSMRDGVNTGDHSDRLLVSWDLLAAGTAEAFPETSTGARQLALLLAETADGRPVLDSQARDVPSGGRVAVSVPNDIERLRLEAPSVARDWRLALRTALSTTVGSPDWESQGFHDGRYIFSRR